MKQRTSFALVRRILFRLCAAESLEVDPWLRDDLRIARLTVAYAASGEAVLCSPHVLATYMVLGLHPEKVWPAIQKRRKALGLEEVLPPKKAVQSVKLWPPQSKSARAANSRAGDGTVLREPTISVPMAAPSIAALYPNSDAPPSAKKRGYTYDEMLAVVKFSGAPQSIRLGTLNALTARGRWPNEDGPANGIICVSLAGMMLGNAEGCGNVVRSTARWRARRAVKLGYWRQLRDANSWSNCPKCGAARDSGNCGKCPYKGRAKTPEGKANFDEFCRPYMYEINIEAFHSASRPKGIRDYEARVYADHKEAVKRAGHGNVREMPRKPSQPTPDPPAAPVRQSAAEHAHRNPVQSAGRSLTPRQRKELAHRITLYERGVTEIRFANNTARQLKPGDREYVKPMGRAEAILAACQSMARGDPARDLEPHGDAFQKARESALEMEAGS